MLKSLILMIQLLTTIPIPVRINFDETRIKKGILFIPLVGLLVGSILYGLFLLVRMVTDNRLLTGLFVVAGELLLTGFLHLDGLADSFDGLFSGRDREKIFKIMKDPAIGTNGIVALIILIVAKIVLISELQGFYILLYPLYARTGLIISAGISNYAKEEGMGHYFIKNTSLLHMLFAFLLTLGFSLFLLGPVSIIHLVTLILFSILFTLFVIKKIGGTTGDTLGAVLELNSVVVLLTGVLLPW